MKIKPQNQKISEQLINSGAPFVQNFTITFDENRYSLSCPSCVGKMYSMNYESSFHLLRKKVDKYVKNTTLKEILKNLKNLFVVRDSIFFFLNNF